MSRRAIVSALWGAQQEVLKRLSDQQGPLTVFSLPGLVTVEQVTALRAEGMELVDLLSILAPEERRQAHESAQRDWSSLQDELIKDPSDGWKTGVVGDPALATLILETLQSDLPTVALLLAALDRVVHTHDIALVVVSEDMQAAGKTLVNWAKRRAIPSLHLAHALALADPYTVHAHLQADVLAVYGERGCEGYLDLGIEPGRLRITGNPAWDGYSHWRTHRAAARQTLCEQNGRPVDRPIILFGTTWAANLTAMGNEHIYGDTLLVFLDACEQLRRAGWSFTAVVKDRPANAHFGSHRCAELLAELSADASDYLHTSDNGRDWLLAADVLVAVDSNYSIEAMLAGTPAINLQNLPGTLLGPSFDASSGVLEVEASELADTLATLLGDNDRRRALVAEMDARAAYYNLGVDGLATERVVNLMSELMTPRATTETYVWQTHLDVSDGDVEAAYHQAAREELIGAFDRPPRLVLDIGCAAGATGGLFKQRFPQSQVWGIEVNESAAKFAAERMDRVLIGKFEDFDLQAEGISPGTLDGVILGDVLEHLYNPWAVMKALLPLLAADAQIIISIPNVRNLWLMAELAQGYWKYEAAGLLDVTHIRFFTLAEFRRFLFETGYHVETLTYLLDGRLAQAYHDNKDKQDVSLQIDNLSLNNLQPDDVSELCSLQFLIRARVGRRDEDLVRRYAEPAIISTEASDQAVSAAPVVPAAKPVAESADYNQWLKERASSLARLEIYRQALVERRQLRFQAVVFGSAEAARETLVSLDEQFYPIDDIVRIDQVGDVFAEWQAVAQKSNVDWTLRLNAGDLLDPEAVLKLAECITLTPAAKAIYCDEDRRDAAELKNPTFRPSFNLDLLRSYPYTGRFLAVARDTFQKSNASIANMGEGFVQDLLLQVVERHGVGAIVHVPQVLYHAGLGFAEWLASLPSGATQGVVSAHLERLGIEAEVTPAAAPMASRVRYALPSPTPRVSVLIMGEASVEELSCCLESILSHTDYPDYEVIIGRPKMVAPSQAQWLDGIEALGVSNLSVREAEGYNELVAATSGGCLVLFDTGCLCLEPLWLSELVSQIVRAEVGAAGAKLVDRSGRVVRSGLVFGLRGPVSGLFEGEADDRGGYLHRLQVTQNFSAIDGQCLAIRREVFEELNGLSSEVPSRVAAIDLCARIGQAGYLLVWTPYARLGWESARALDPLSAEEDEQLYLRWARLIGQDPSYNPNMAHDAADFTMETDRDNLWLPLPWRPLPVIQAMPGDRWGCGHYRIIQPFQAMEQALLVDGTLQNHYLHPANQARIQPDSIVVQRQLSDEQLREMRRLKRLDSAFLVYDLDDLLGSVPIKSIHYKDLPKAQVTRSLRNALSIADRVVVSTAPLAEALRSFNDDIVIMPNRLPVDWWKEVHGGRRSGKPRVGWAGGSSHAGDLQIIVDVIRALEDEVEWVFMGMPPPGVRVHEYHDGVSIEAFPEKLASLDLDIALAPLEMNRFNRCKSNLRLLEMGACGFSVIATDIEPYRCGLPVTLVRNRFKDWRDAIREQLADRDASREQGAKLREAIHREWMLEGASLRAWQAAWLPG